MAGLVAAIHVLTRRAKSVDARDEPGHDDLPHLTERNTTRKTPGNSCKLVQECRN
jgi:hypothetical protein